MILLLASAAAFDIQGWDWTHHQAPVEEPFLLNVQSFPASYGSEEDLEAAYLLAQEIWNAEGEAGVYLTYGGQTTDETYGGGNNDSNTLFWHPRDYGIALAQARYNAIDGQMTDCDIRIYGENDNGTKVWSYAEEGAPEGSYDLTHTVIHEFGHCLGLGHSAVDGAIMESKNQPGTGWERRHLHPDDQAGIQQIYGRAEVALEIAESVFTEEDEDGVGTPGERLAIEVRLRNAGTGWAIGVVGQLETEDTRVRVSGDTSLLGDLAPQASAGSYADTLRFLVSVEERCDANGELVLALMGEDVMGNAVAGTLTYPLDCGDGGPVDVVLEEEPLACGCRSGVGSNASWTRFVGWLSRR